MNKLYASAEIHISLTPEEGKNFTREKFDMLAIEQVKKINKWNKDKNIAKCYNNWYTRKLSNRGDEIKFQTTCLVEKVAENYRVIEIDCGDEDFNLLFPQK